MNFYEEELVVKRLYARVREHSRGHVYANQRRESDSLIFVIEGRVEMTSGEQTVTLLAGESVFIPVGASTRASHIDEYNKTLNIFFDTLEGSLGTEMTKFKKNELALATAAELAEMLSREGALDSNLLRFSFHKLVFHITSDKAVDRKYLKIHSLMLELETHYAENLSLAEYARRYLMSESSLRSLFREYTGKSVIQYRNAVRLRRAEELIRDGMRVGEAAVAVGFSSASFYCRQVKKYSRK